ncbi:30S ribosomal protein S14 [Kineococcus indalonis]|uniref:30S ribosomal protein S14 n=1 Tax=Kineococcus indalonis TaxID=2696566 RepID=UPI001412620B|nr:30S ribosomal protein S14 [Kineococcus indalonis]NAZ88041.1 30S ribosomal protein S14 [Kineococcus indalonis]
MAKKSEVAEDEQRKLTVARHAGRRAQLERAAVGVRASEDERAAARLALQRLPRDAGPTRVRHRDAVDGRPRGNPRAFGISRTRLRETAHAGELPGVRRSSW